MEELDLQGLIQRAADEAVRRVREEEAAAGDVRVREMEGELKKFREAAEAAEKREVIRETLHKSGVQNVELAYRAIRDEVARGADGKWIARDAEGEKPFADFVKGFLESNPELLPARGVGGSGSSGARVGEGGGGFDLESIRPGMDPAELSRVRSEVARLISYSK